MSSRQMRLLTSSDADLAIKYSILVHNDPDSSLEKFKHFGKIWDSKYQNKSFLVEVEGIPMAVATYHEWVYGYEPGKYVVKIDVHPDYRRQGYGSDLYEFLREQLASETPRAKILMCKCRDDQPESVSFVRKRGFLQSGREQAVELTVADFDSARFEAAAQRMSEQGIEIVTYAELARVDPECQRQLYELCMITFPDAIPDKLETGTFTPKPFEHFVEEKFEENPSCIPEAYLVALHNGRYVGQSDLVDERHDGENLGAGYTAVHPDYRRRGIATALKMYGIRYAQEHGFKKIITDHDSRNPIYQLNLQLGFKPTPGYLFFEMKLE